MLWLACIVWTWENKHQRQICMFILIYIYIYICVCIQKLYGNMTKAGISGWKIASSSWILSPHSKSTIPPENLDRYMVPPNLWTNWLVLVYVGTFPLKQLFKMKRPLFSCWVRARARAHVFNQKARANLRWNENPCQCEPLSSEIMLVIVNRTEVQYMLEGISD